MMVGGLIPTFIQFQRGCLDRARNNVCKSSWKRCRKNKCSRIEEFKKEVEEFYVEHKGIKYVRKRRKNSV